MLKLIRGFVYVSFMLNSYIFFVTCFRFIWNALFLFYAIFWFYVYLCFRVVWLFNSSFVCLFVYLFVCLFVCLFVYCYQVFACSLITNLCIVEYGTGIETNHEEVTLYQYSTIQYSTVHTHRKRID